MERRTDPPRIAAASRERVRLRITIRGTVQGVGFRPFVYRLASELHLSGWIGNSSQGVAIEVEGPRADLEGFLLRLEAEQPPRSSIHSLEALWLDACGYDRLEIRPSQTGGAKTAIVLPDVATCPDCLRELFDPSNRRYRYPFANCTNCGPRFSITEALPYDRVHTSMRVFTMCPQCQAEYDDPWDRRFHAQPNACPECGPQLALLSAAYETLSTRDEALLAAAASVRKGRIVAIKGLGGFHLIVAAHDEQAVRRLRERKHREEKPFALMFPSMEAVRRVCEVSTLEARLLRSPEAPIVLIRRRSRDFPGVAPGNPYFGVMLPYTPLHHLFLAELGFAVVATSGNRSDEPICTDEGEAVERLAGIADVFLVHNRPIVRPVDDSILRVVGGRELMLRRARGFAPLPVALKAELPAVLAVGAQLKNTVALAVGSQVFLSQHLGDLQTTSALAAFRRAAADLPRLYDVRPETLAADLHPDYPSTRFAEESDVPVVQVQHHYAHVMSCMAENEIESPVLGVCWDGTGYGLDGSIWGGEFLRVTDQGFERVASLRPFRLPGGEKAVREPCRTALGLLHEIFAGSAFERLDLPPVAAFSVAERIALKAMLTRGLNSPWCCSMGRLFDAVAALLDLRQRIGFEGQAAMELEFALEGVATDEAYPMAQVDRERSVVVDWAPTIEAVLADVECGESLGVMSARFHNALVEAIVDVARRAGEMRVVLTGGCFQNRYLAERAVFRLREQGFHPYWHRRVPPNDGGIALGQVIAAAREKSQSILYVSRDSRKN